ncbi:MAG: hypothetical protein R2794_12995 [Chitinophagales bacterium]
MKNPIALLLLSLATLSFGAVRAQTNTFPPSGSAGIGTTTPDPSALLELSGTSGGLLAPRMTKAQRDAITAPADGLLIFQTNAKPGFYYCYAGNWQPLAFSGANKQLGNLQNTAINADLVPENDGSINLGSAAKKWNTAYVDQITFGDGSMQNTASGGGVAYTAGPGIDISAGVISNTAMDLPVTISGGAGIAVTGSYPSYSLSLIPTGGSGWNLNGNNALTGSDFLGTTDVSALSIRTNNTERLHIQGNGLIEMYGGGLNTILRLEATNPKMDFVSDAQTIGYISAYGPNNNFELGLDPSNTTGKVAFYTGGAARVFLENNGNLTLNAALNQAQLHINSDAGEDAIKAQVNGSTKFIVHSNGSTSIGSSASGPSNGMYISGAVSMNTALNNARLHINAGVGEDALLIQLNDVSKMGLHSNGSLSVGSNVAGPNDGLYVLGNTSIGTAINDAQLVINAGVGEDVFKANGNGINYMLIHDNGNISLSTNDADAQLALNGTAGELALKINVDGTTKFAVHDNGSISAGSITEGPSNGLYVLGNTSIGTTLSFAKLQVNAGTGEEIFKAQTDGATKFQIHANGSASIGSATAGPDNGMYSSGHISIGTTVDEAVVNILAETGVDPLRVKVNGFTKWMVHANGSTSIGSPNAGPADGLFISGAVAIGTNTPASGYALSVEGKVICEELKIQLHADWPDYVFSDDFTLPDIDSLRGYIAEHKHLPGVPSADQVAETGISIGEMQIITMQKVEELTLYIIQLSEENKTLRCEMEKLQAGSH